MHKTIFQTPVLSQLFFAIGWLILKLSGWRTSGHLPADPKAIIIGAPHTSNWDFPLAMAAIFTRRWPMYWVGKHTLFRPAYGWFMRWLGGIALDRSQASNTVNAYVDLFAQHDSLYITLAPEGTRSLVTRWKSGFYHIAAGAQIPIVLGFIDKKTKTIGLGPAITVTGNLEKDMETIGSYYASKEGIKPELFALPDLDAMRRK